MPSHAEILDDLANNDQVRAGNNGQDTQAAVKMTRDGPPPPLTEREVEEIVAKLKRLVASVLAPPNDTVDERLVPQEEEIRDLTLAPLGGKNRSILLPLLRSSIFVTRITALAKKVSFLQRLGLHELALDELRDPQYFDLLRSPGVGPCTLDRLLQLALGEQRYAAFKASVLDAYMNLKRLYDWKYDGQVCDIRMDDDAPGLTRWDDLHWVVLCFSQKRGAAITCHRQKCGGMKRENCVLLPMLGLSCIPDAVGADDLRRMEPEVLGMARAAYSTEGVRWCDNCTKYERSPAGCLLATPPARPTRRARRAGAVGIVKSPLPEDSGNDRVTDPRQPADQQAPPPADEDEDESSPLQTRVRPPVVGGDGGEVKVVDKKKVVKNLANKFNLVDPRRQEPTPAPVMPPVPAGATGNGSTLAGVAAQAAWWLLAIILLLAACFAHTLLCVKGVCEGPGADDTL